MAVYDDVLANVDFRHSSQHELKFAKSRIYCEPCPQILPEKVQESSFEAGQQKISEIQAFYSLLWT